MTNSRRGLSLATAVLLLVAGTSCANNRSRSQDPQPKPTSTSPSPTVTTTSPSEAATAAATALILKYYAIRNDLRRDPKQPLSRLKDIATSTELTAQETLIRRERNQGLHQTGETKVVKFEVGSVNLDNSDPQAGNVPTVQIDVCFDVSDVDVLDADGKSVVSPERPDTGWIRYSVANYQWDSDPDGAWRVASSQDIKRTPCAA